MRLLNIRTLQLEEFFEQDVPRYCILSHRWQGKEITYKEFRKGLRTDSPSYKKIVDFCSFVQGQQQDSISSDEDEDEDEDGQFIVDWVWIDTCCIDKRSSAELSEAINSMYAWYKNSECCIVYLVDVTSETGEIDFYAELSASAWFRRGWTLQELLAPYNVVFCNAHWNVIGAISRRGSASPWGKKPIPELSVEISKITGVPDTYLLTERFEPNSVSVAKRMSWAARRRTSRVEDEAYCLLGIFDINMPLIYGEGRRAFLRLQEEIIKRSADQSIFAWSISGEDSFCSGILAGSPRFFGRSGDVETTALGLPYAITNRGLQLRATSWKIPESESDLPTASDAANGSPASTGLYLLELNCGRRTSDDENRSSGAGLPSIIAIGGHVGPEPYQFWRVHLKDLDRLIATVCATNSREQPLERTFHIDTPCDLRPSGAKSPALASKIYWGLISLGYGWT
ncbi:hypothetical protein LTR37_009401 [Vermiconidia calcicola]|uniref:Uncharacterized protein n=1 Tax=Vermiconidia calcicola TaxID=1690605 RepID=A0ACC3N8A5_9PEZI|nr:hypothetical protein LTR37_009401 [Vermiconidia calcicola]